MDRGRLVTTNSEAVRELIGNSCGALNAEDYAAFLALCAADFHYQLIAYSPEIRGEMTWMNYDRKGLEVLFKDLPTHLHVPLGSLFRHVSTYSVTPAEEAGQVTAKSSVLIIFTDADGVSKLFAAARYFDVVTLKNGQPLLVNRQTQLETRDIGVGTPIPL
jgi:methanesulfonate monooxygenase subunit beta